MTTQSDRYWSPDVGDMVWLNYPDASDPLGKVVGFVPDGENRAGQPIIERTEDKPARGTFDREEKKGDKSVMHPMFMLPFPYGGEEWQAAKAEGRVDGR